MQSLCKKVVLVGCWGFAGGYLRVLKFYVSETREMLKQKFGHSRFLLPRIVVVN